MSREKFNITPELWNFIEANVPNCHEREDVLRQANLQVFIDNGDQTYIQGITRDEAIVLRDRILFRLYQEAIDNYTRQTPEQKELDDKLNEICKDENRCGQFGELLMEEIIDDTEPYHKVGHQVIDAYREKDCDALLLGLCGWTMESFIKKLD